MYYCDKTHRRGGCMLAYNSFNAVSPCSKRKHTQIHLSSHSKVLIFHLLFNSIDQNSLTFTDAALKFKTWPWLLGSNAVTQNETSLLSNRELVPGYVVGTRLIGYRIAAGSTF